jgi:cell division septum initiation protein DivIVA
MKEVDALVENIASSLKDVADNIAQLAEKIDAMADTTAAKAEAPAKPAAKKSAAKKRARKKAPAKKAPAKRAASKKAPTASDVVRTAIYRYKNGVSVTQLKKKTGFNDKKIANIVYKLKKQGEVVSPAKGVYQKP